MGIDEADGGRTGEATMANSESGPVPDMLTPEILTPIWMKAFEEKRFQDALLLGFVSYLIFRERNSEDEQMASLLAMRAVIDNLSPRGRGDECSFCGRRPPAVRLAAGPDAFICDDCVSTLSATFRESDGR
jgi:hypothetical protein